jgi:hypothetical protein
LTNSRYQDRGKKHNGLVFIKRLNNKLFVKLADSALSRDIFSNDYHCLGDNENRPIMWLAFESIKKNVYTVQTDIVSLFFREVPFDMWFHSILFLGFQVDIRRYHMGDFVIGRSALRKDRSV